MSQPGYPPSPGEPQGPGVPQTPPFAPAGGPQPPFGPARGPQPPFPPAAGGPQPPFPAAGGPPPRRPRRALLITSIVLGVVLLLCGGGGVTAYFLVKNVGGSGTATPAAAVDGFLTAVFRDHDVDKASRYVCAESRDKAALGRKIDELRSYEQRYKSPRYSWPTPSVQSHKDKTATLTVAVTITTADERTAEKRLTFVAVDKSGWWVCEVRDAR